MFNHIFKGIFTITKTHLKKRYSFKRHCELKGVSADYVGIGRDHRAPRVMTRTPRVMTRAPPVMTRPGMLNIKAYLHTPIVVL
jgi:hypothetical protein